MTNTPGVLTDATADLAMALLLAVTQRALVEGAKVPGIRAALPAGVPTWMMGVGLRGKKLGIVGMGRIGEAVARRAKAFGLAIHYHNRKSIPSALEAELGAIYWPDLDAMLPARWTSSRSIAHTTPEHLPPVLERRGSARMETARPF